MSVYPGGEEDFAQAVGGAALASGGMVSLKSSGTPGSSSKHDRDGGSDGSKLYKKDGKKHKSKQQGGGSSKKHRKQ